jgi:L-lactate permease
VQQNFFDIMLNKMICIQSVAIFATAVGTKVNHTRACRVYTFITKYMELFLMKLFDK